MKSAFSRRTAFKISILTTAMLWGTSSWAQASAADTPARVSPGEPSTQQEFSDIVVTANKREERLQDVGVTVTALGSQALERQRINSLADIADVVPGLDFTQTWVGSPVYTLRGVGFYDASISAYPDVATYIDQFALPFPETSTLTAFDLERIEVLKGPQGTLFGNNATGGAINFIAAKPKSTFEAGGSMGYARFNTFDASGYATGPLTDTLSARLAFKVMRGDEWQKSYTRNDNLGKTNTSAARLLLDWKPTDRLTVSLNLNGWLNRSDPQAPQYYRSTPQYPVGASGLGGSLPADAPILNYPIAPFTPQAADWDPRDRPFQRNSFWQAAGRIDYALTDNLTLTSLTSYLQTRIRSENNYDGTDLADYQVQFRKASINSFGQEIRLANDPASSLRFVVGGNYDSSQTHDQGDIVATGSTSHFVNALCCSQYLSDESLHNYAAFGNLEYEIFDRLTLKAGVRRTRAEARAVSLNRQEDASVGNRGEPRSTTDFFNIVWGSLSFIYPNYQPIPQGAAYTIDNRLDPNGQPLDPATYGTAGAYRGTLKQNSTSWTVGLDYKPTDDVLLYATVAKGYKAGGFPTVSAATWSQFLPVVQEQLTDYEAGFKTQFAGNRITFNGAAFYYDYKDKQTRAKIIDGIFGLLDALVNVPKSEVWGAEAELGLRPATGLSVNMSATYLKSKIKEYNGVVASAVDPTTGLFVPVTADYAGVPLAFTPKLQFSGSFDYEHPVDDRHVASVGFNVSAQTKSYTVLALTASDQAHYVLDGRAIFGANVGFRDAEDRYAINIWGKNIFNKYYITNSILGYDSQIRYAGRPAEYGVSVSFKFK